MATITLFQSPAADMPDAMTHLKTSISDFVDDLKSLNDKV